MRVLVILIAAILAVSVKAEAQQRIIGGALTTINEYPFAAALLLSPTANIYTQSCGGTILNQRSILTTAHCFIFYVQPVQWRIRVGSSWANSGGVIYNTLQIIRHPSYNSVTIDYDAAIVRASGVIAYSNVVQPASIVGANYIVPDNAVVWTIGWGLTSYNGQPSEQLRHVQIWTINQAVCRQRYLNWNVNITDNMLCAGWLDNGSRDTCAGDDGSPLLHNNVVVGVTSFGHCGSYYYPGVNARVSRLSVWIQTNA